MEKAGDSYARVFHRSGLDADRRKEGRRRQTLYNLCSSYPVICWCLHMEEKFGGLKKDKKIKKEGSRMFCTGFEAVGVPHTEQAAHWWWR